MRLTIYHDSLLEMTQAYLHDYVKGEPNPIRNSIEQERDFKREWRRWRVKRRELAKLRTRGTWDTPYADFYFNEPRWVWLDNLPQWISHWHLVGDTWIPMADRRKLQ